MQMRLLRRSLQHVIWPRYPHQRHSQRTATTLHRQSRRKRFHFHHSLTLSIFKKIHTFAPPSCPNGEMVDTKDLKSFGHNGCAGSSPASGTKDPFIQVMKGFFVLGVIRKFNVFLWQRTFKKIGFYEKINLLCQHTLSIGFHQ